MRTSLSVESLEDRRVLSAYTIEILDRQNLVPDLVESQMRAAADFSMRNLDTFISWKGILDLRIDIQPPNPNGADGGAWAIMSGMPDGRNATVQEMVTGVDPYPKDPDIGLNLQLGYDGTVKIYGMKVFFDPNPRTYMPVNLPAGYIDFIGVVNHEVAHGLGFNGSSDFYRYVTVVGNQRYFNGPETVKLLGQPLPLTNRGGTHYGNTDLPGNPVFSGLMFEWGHYAGNRLDYGKLDLAILKDVGLSIKTTQGLPLTDTNDSQAPQPTISQSIVDSSVPIGTVVGALTTRLGSAGYSFQLVGNGYDNGNFAVMGKALVTATNLNQTARNSYTILVRSIDPKGVWTDGLLQVGVKNLNAPPSLKAPAAFVMSGPSLSLGSLQVGGYGGTLVSLLLAPRTGSVTFTTTDPSVKVCHARNSTGGQNVLLVGTADSINRVTRYLSYQGNDPSIRIFVNATLDGTYRCYGQADVLISRLTLSNRLTAPIGRVTLIAGPPCR